MAFHFGSASMVFSYSLKVTAVSSFKDTGLYAGEHCTNSYTTLLP